jgi:hypothetical protein
MAYELEWRMMVGESSAAPNIWNELTRALSNGVAILPPLWAVLFVVAVVVGIVRLVTRSNKLEPAESKLLCFSIITAVVALFTYYNFMRRLIYSPRPWYYLALIACAAALIDLLANLLCRSVRLRVARLVLVVAIVLVSAPAVWPKLFRAQSNVSAICRALGSQAGADDVIVVERWTVGVSFNWYYHGSTRWMTVPPVSDHRSHRYDLLKAKLSDPLPLRDLEETMRATLDCGHRVWVVTEGDENKYWPTPLPTTPAPDPRVGWNQWAYRRLWFEQLHAFLRAHSQKQYVAIPAMADDGAYENLMVNVAEGWRE